MSTSESKTTFDNMVGEFNKSIFRETSLEVERWSGGDVERW